MSPWFYLLHCFGKPIGLKTDCSLVIYIYIYIYIKGLVKHTLGRRKELSSTLARYVFYPVRIDMFLCSIKLLFCNVFIRSFDC